MQPNQRQLEQIKSIAIANPTIEVCGQILDGEVIECANLSPHPDRHFEFLVDDRASLVWHSHCNGNDDFSIDDIVASKELEKPYFLYCVQTGETRYFNPIDRPSYCGRSFHWAWQNCYTLIQDYYKQELGLAMDNFYLRSPESYLYEDVGYVENLPSQGFRRLERGEAIRKNDLLLGYEGLNFPNHTAIAIDPAEGKILHHLPNRLSGFGKCGHGRSKDTHSIWRAV